MKQRDVNLREFNLSSDAYRELKYFCYQYREKREKAMRARGLPGLGDGMPRGSEVGDPTEKRAWAAMRYLADCELIEQCALDAAEGWGYQPLMKNVTEGIPFQSLDIPCGRKKFLQIRKRFFYLLAIKKGVL